MTAFEAIRRGQMDVSEPRNLCSRTRVKDFPPGGPDGGRPPGLSPRDSYSCYIVACLMLVQGCVHGVVFFCSVACCVTLLFKLSSRLFVCVFVVVAAYVGPIFCECGHDFRLYCFLLLTILLLDSIVLIATC